MEHHGVDNPSKVEEIARVATKIDHSVVGGFSRLMKHVLLWSKQNGYEKILTYSDCRYSWGDVYKKYGFSFVGKTVLDYFYTNFYNRYNRFKFRAQNGKSEKQLVEEAGVFRIYGTGNYKWELKL